MKEDKIEIYRLLMAVKSNEISPENALNEIIDIIEDISLYGLFKDGGIDFVGYFESEEDAIKELVNYDEEEWYVDELMKFRKY